MVTLIESPCILDVVLSCLGRLLLLPLSKLLPLLNLVLTLLTIHSTSTYKPVLSPSQPIIDGLADHDVSPQLGRAVLDLFGNVQDEIWDVDIQRTVGEVGKGLLVDLGGRTEGIEVFMERWRDTVGETWAEYCDLKLLEVGTHSTRSCSSSKPPESLEMWALC